MEKKPESQEKKQQTTGNQNPDGGGKTELDSQENNQQPTGNQNPDGGGKTELDSQENNQQPTSNKNPDGGGTPELDSQENNQEMTVESATRSCQIHEKLLSWVWSPLENAKRSWRDLQRKRGRPVETEYFACIGSSFTLQCEVGGLQAIEWQCTNSTERKNITGKIACMNEESAGKYICKVPGCTDVITLSILQPREQQALVNDDVTFDATNCTTNKEYKWSYMVGDNNETDIPDIQPDRRYVVVNNKNTRKLTIKGCRKEDNGIYICRDKETDEQLTAYRLSILQPRVQEAFVNDDVRFDATNCITNKKYKWYYMDGKNNETNIIPNKRWVVVKNKNTCQLTIKCYRKEDNGIYVCRDKKTDEPLIAYRLSILQPREQQAFVNDDVTFVATNCTLKKEYEWTYINGDNNETDIPDKRWMVVKNGDTLKLTIKGCRKEASGIYICRDNEANETLTAYRLKTKYNIKGKLTFNGSPEDEEFKQNLIKGTERLLTTPDHVVEIRIFEGFEEDSPYQIPLVAYLTKGGNNTEFEELMNFDMEAVCVLFIAEHRSLPDIPLDREHVAIRFTKFPNTVKCSFYDDSQKHAWIRLLNECTGEREGSDVADENSGSSVDP